jgi:hypothetical protein
LAASPRKAARLFSIPAHHVHAALKRNEMQSHAVGVRSVLLLDDEA